MAVTRAASQPARTTPAPVTKTVASKVVGGAPEAAAPEGGSGGSLASVFDETPAATNSYGINVPPGKYECIIVHAKVNDPFPAGGQIATIKVEVADVGDEQGKTIDLTYNLVGKDGKPGAGIGFLKRDLAKLGYADIKFADIPEAFGQLAEAMDGVEVLVKINGQYTNAYLQTLIEGSEIVEQWKAARPATPF